MPLLTTYIEKFQDIRVLVIGDIMLDRFMYGKVERISPEAPVPVFKFHHEKKMLGGAGNVAANLTSSSPCRLSDNCINQPDCRRQSSDPGRSGRNSSGHYRFASAL